MNKNGNTWMEGNGTVRTVFRTMVLWEYASPEGSKQQLLRAIGKKEDQTSPYLLRYAVDKRKMEIQWISLYLPLLVLSTPQSHHICQYRVVFIRWHFVQTSAVHPLPHYVRHPQVPGHLSV